MAASNFVTLPGLESEFDQIEKIAVGGMAEIFRGRQKSLDRAVAIKTIRPEYQSNREIQQRFLREANFAGSLLHQNLGHVYDFKKVPDESYIIMEYVDGFDLAEILESTGPLPIEVAAMIATKILLGLGYVHSHGVVHRDIKPDNIRITVRGEVKIMDFGIALDLADQGMTQPGIVIGSPHYLSPEQIKGSKLDARSDIFSFGITFYEMLTGKRPFVEDAKQTLFDRISSGDYVPLQKLRPEIPGLIVSLVDRCLKRDPKNRAASVESLAAILQEYVHTQLGTNLEARVRKFLMEFDFLKGNPESVLVQERTAEIKIKSSTQLMVSRWAIPALALFAGAMASWVTAKVYYDHGSDVPVVGEQCEVPAITPKPRTPPNKPAKPAPVLPGTPVQEN